jgi:hypothetical protein
MDMLEFKDCLVLFAFDALPRGIDLTTIMVFSFCSNESELDLDIEVTVI